MDAAVVCLRRTQLLVLGIGVDTKATGRHNVPMPLEKTIVAAAIAAAKNLGWVAYKIHGNAFQVAGLPDILCIKGGRVAWMEAKRLGNKPTPVQVRRMLELEKAGCWVTVIHSGKEAKTFLESCHE